MLRLWPRSLAARTALLLLAALTVVQVAGLTIHALDRVDLQRLAQARDVAVRAIGLYRSVALTPPDQRAGVVREFDLPDGSFATLDPGPPRDNLPITAVPLQRQIRADMQLVPMPQSQRPRDLMLLGGPAAGRLVAGFNLPGGAWLNVSIDMPPPRPWHSSTFLIAFIGMTAAAALLTLWAVRRLIGPVATLAAAADALGRDVNAAPLPEDGPTEVATAAHAFNTMAARIRRLVQDRTLMLTAIGHDLRTPMTRLKLRAEFLDDPEMQRKMLADLDELEAMVSATLAFGRDITIDEPAGPVDLVALLRTIMDEAADARPEFAERLSYTGPDSLPVRARTNALHRALGNLVGNALAFAGNADLTLTTPQPDSVTLLIEDDGPGVPASELDRVFQPFHRVEASRNRETGGVGLGLPIARNIVRAHGGDVTFANRPQGGAKVTVTMPV